MTHCRKALSIKNSKTHSAIDTVSRVVTSVARQRRAVNDYVYVARGTRKRRLWRNHRKERSENEIKGLQWAGIMHNVSANGVMTP